MDLQNKCAIFTGGALGIGRTHDSIGLEEKRLLGSLKLMRVFMRTFRV